MIGLLKKIFAKKETEIAVVLEANLLTWYDDQVIPIKSKADQQIIDNKDQIKAEIKSSEVNLKKLDEALLQNPNIPIRQKQFMHGNRQAYIRRIQSFLGSLNVEEMDADELEAFCKNFEEQFLELGKSTQRQSTILREFFHNESRDISENISNLRKYIQDLKKILDNSEYGIIQNLRDDIKLYISNKDLTQQLSTSIGTLETEVARQRKDKENAKINIAEIEKSPEYHNVQQAENKVVITEGELKSSKQAFLDKFSTLESALRKYSYTQPQFEPLINTYIDNPVNGLLNDSHFEIVKVLDALSQALLKDEIDLKDKKKEKTLSLLNDMNDIYLSSMVKRIQKLQIQLDNDKAELILDPQNKSLELLRSKIIELDTTITTTESQLTQSKSQLQKYDKAAMKKSLEQDIEQKLMVKIVIS